jgi:hypothetical protein
MKEMNHWENHLRSWAPRRPSATLKRRIFNAPPPLPRLVVWSLRCLAPATACLLLAMAVLSPDSTGTAGTSGPRPLAALILSNQIAYWPGPDQRPRNAVSPFTLEWTNRSGSTSSTGSFSRGGVD